MSASTALLQILFSFHLPAFQMERDGEKTPLWKQFLTITAAIWQEAVGVDIDEDVIIDLPTYVGERASSLTYPKISGDVSVRPFTT